MTQTDDRIAAEPELTQPTAGPRRFTFITSAIVVLLIAGAVGVVAIIRASFGEPMASAAAMPADTQIYLNIDFGAFDDLDRLLGAFDAAFAEAGLEPGLDTVIDEIDAELQAQLGVGVDEVTSWAGRDLGIGIGGLDLAALADPLGAEVPVPDIIAALAVRDPAGADAFIDKLVANLAARDQVTFSEDSYRDVRLLAADIPSDGLQPAVGRSDDLLLLASSPAALRRAIDAHQGTSLADSSALDETMDLLPGGRAATLYVSGDLIDSLFDAELVAGAFGDVGLPENTVRSFAMSLALTNDGVRFDVAQLNADDTVVGSVEDLAGSSDLPQRFGEDTFLYVGADLGGPSDEAFNLEDALAQAGLPESELQQVKEALSQFEADVGVDIQADIIDLLGTSFGFGMFETAVPTLDLPVGLTVLLGTRDPVAMTDTLDKLGDFARSQGIAVSPRSFEGGVAYTVDVGDGQELIVGVAEEFVVVGTEMGSLTGVTADGPSLADSAFYREAVGALGTAEPVFYLDLATALRVFDAPPDVVRNLAPVQGVIAGGEGVTNGSRFTVLTLIDY